MNQQRARRMNTKVHYRLYKRGKQWVTVCLASTAFAGVLLGLSTTTTKAATATTATDTVTQQDKVPADTLAGSTVALNATSSRAPSDAAAASNAASQAPSDAAAASSAASQAPSDAAAASSAASQAPSDAAAASSAASQAPDTAAASSAASQAPAAGQPGNETVNTKAALPVVTSSLVNSAGEVLEAPITAVANSTSAWLPLSLSVDQDVLDRAAAAGITLHMPLGSWYRLKGYRLNGGELQTSPLVTLPVVTTTDATGATVTQPVTLEVVYDLTTLTVTHVYPDGADATNSNHQLNQIVITAYDDQSLVDTSAQKQLTITFNGDQAKLAIADSGVTLGDPGATTVDFDALKQTLGDDAAVNAAVTALTAAFKENGLPLLSRKTIQQALTAVGIGLDGQVDATNPRLSKDITAVQYVYDPVITPTPVTDDHQDLLDKLKDFYQQALTTTPTTDPDLSTVLLTKLNDFNAASQKILTDQANANQQAQVTVATDILTNGVVTPLIVDDQPLTGQSTYHTATTINLPASFTLSGQHYDFVGYALADDAATVDPDTLVKATDIAVTPAPLQDQVAADGTVVTDKAGQPVQQGSVITVQAVYQATPASVTVHYVYDDAKQTQLAPAQTVTATQTSTPDLADDRLTKIVLTPSTAARQNGAPDTLTLAFNSDYTVTHLILNAGSAAEKVLPVAYETVGGLLANEVDPDLVQAMLADAVQGGIDGTSANTNGDLYQGLLTHLAATGIQLNGTVALTNAEQLGELSDITYVYAPPALQQATVQVIDENTNKVLEKHEFTGYAGQTAATDIAALVSKYTAAGKKVLVNNVPDTLTFDDDAHLPQTYTLRVVASVPYTVRPTVANTPIPDYEVGITGEGLPGSVVELPTIPGYTTTAMPVVPDQGGDINVPYTPNTVTAKVTIPSNLGPQTVNDVTGTIGSTVTVTVPNVPGYTPDKVTVPATVNPSGTITTDQTVTYTPNTVTAEVTIPSNLGPQTVNNVTGTIGSTVTVTVPSIDGYTPDKVTVPATVNPSGTITTDQTVTYTAKTTTTTATPVTDATKPATETSTEPASVTEKSTSITATKQTVTQPVKTATATQAKAAQLPVNTTAAGQAVKAAATPATKLPQTDAVTSAWLSTAGLLLLGLTGGLVAFKQRRNEN